MDKARKPRRVRRQAKTLHECIREFLTPAVWKQARQAANRRKKPRWDVHPLCFVLLTMTWCCGDSLPEKFETARGFYVACHAKRRRPGETFQGFQQTNVKLYTEDRVEMDDFREGPVYYWPEAVQKQGGEPIRARLIRLRGKSKRRRYDVWLLTNVMDPKRLSNRMADRYYRWRWESELDIRSIKDSLNLGHVRCKSPEMVRRELWTTILGYNLIRVTAMNAAALYDKQPRQISFTGTCQYVREAWMPISSGLIRGSDLHHFCLVMLRMIADCEVGNRPGRLEPRVLKRRRHGYKLMRKPRETLRAELRKHCT